MNSKLGGVLLGGAVLVLLATFSISCNVTSSGGGGGIAPADFVFDGDGDTDGNQPLEFDVQAGETTTLGVNGTFMLPQGVVVGAGTVQIPLDAVQVEGNVDTNGKVVPLLQVGEPISVTVWVDAFGEAPECASGDEYGPFMVTLDEDFNPTSIDPSEVDLTERTVDLINAGELAVCISVNWTQDARITVSRVTFDLN